MTNENAMLNWELDLSEIEMSIPEAKRTFERAVADAQATLGLQQQSSMRVAVVGADDIRYDSSGGENCVDPDTLSAGGEIPVQAHDALLIMLSVKKAFYDKRDGEGLIFCDQEGALMGVSTWKWQGHLEKFFPPQPIESIKAKAEALGLIAKPMSLSIEDEGESEEDVWF